MKKIIVVLIFTCSVIAAKNIINLKSTKDKFYTTPFLTGVVAYHVYDYPVVILHIDYSKFSNILYEKDETKQFWLMSEILVTMLQKNSFAGSDYFYFALIDAKEKEGVRNIIFKVSTAKLKAYEKRDFDKKDKELLESDNIQKYHLPSAYALLDSITIVTTKNKELQYSEALTKRYKKFLKDFVFDTVGDMENKILENERTATNVKKNIWGYCIDGDFEKVKLYTQLGFDLDKQESENQQTCLQYAALNGHYKMVKYLVKHGADVNKHKSGFENAYLAAKRLKHKKIAQYLKPLTKLKSRYVKSQSTHASGNYGLPKNKCYRVSSNYALWNYCNTGNCNGFVSNYALHQLCKYDSYRGFYGSDRKTNISLYLRNGGYLSYDYFSNKAAYQSGKYNGSFQDRKNFILYLESGVTLMKY